jgi:L-ascorbate metabolism protein UlaG (beta-lactamase superfamily)
MGHAGLFIESGDDRILVDPILRTTPLASGSVVHTYPRALTLAAMPRPTLLVLSHGHLDHFDPQSLAQLDRDVPVLLPHDPGMHQELANLGFRRLVGLAPWESHVSGGVKLTTVRSHAEIDEFGVLFEAQGTRFLHLADSEPALADAKRLRAEGGPVDLMSIKFQPAAPGHGVFRALGPHFDKRQVGEWLECVLALTPRYAFPYASGVRYDGRHEWLNRYAFPFRGEEIVRLLQPQLGAGQEIGTVLPGDVFELTKGTVTKTTQASPFVRHAPDGRGEPEWLPFDASTLPGLDSDAEHEELDARLLELLKKEIAPWIAQRSTEEGSPIRAFADMGACYQLVVHTGGEPLQYAIDFRAARLAVVAGRHPEANYFACISGRTLLDVLRGDKGPELFYMSGDARVYEKIIAMEGGKVRLPPVSGWELFERLPEPLTHYLRHTRPAR